MTEARNLHLHFGAELWDEVRMDLESQQKDAMEDWYQLQQEAEIDRLLKEIEEGVVYAVE